LVIMAVFAGVVVVYSADPPKDSEAQTDSAPAGCRVTVTADVLNVRAGPGMDAEVVGTFVQDTETPARSEVRNGFRRIDAHRWASEKFLEPVKGADCG
jgi:hypothetical protein